MEAKLNAIEKILDIMDGEIVTKVEFLSAFEKAIDYLKKREDLNAKELERAVSIIEKSIRNVEGNSIDANKKTLAEARGIVDKHAKQLEKSHTKLIKEIEKKIAQFRVEIPELPEFPEISADFIRNSLEVLQGDDRLHMSAIAGVDDLLERLERLEMASGTLRTIGGGLRAI